MEPGRTANGQETGGGTATAAPRLKAAAADTIGQLWVSVFIKPANESPKTVVITSAERGEGATEIAAALGLAGSASQEGSRVVVADFNLRDPDLAGRLGARSRPGLFELIRGTAKLDDALVRVTGDLSVLPAGEPSESPMSALRHERVRAILAELSSRFDHTILDAPAVNQYPDASILAGMTDGVVLVAGSARTPRETVAEARRRIEHAGGKVIGVVLNRRSFPIPGFLYRRL